MPSSDLSALSRASSNDRPNRRRRGFPAWLLPVLLLLGFLALLTVLFGKRLLPAVEVKVAPVVTIRKDSDSPREEGKAPAAEPILLFQASGWIEPDPYPIVVPTLVNGVVDEVFVLEGETVEKDQVLARLIDEDAVLDLREAESRLSTLQAEIEAANAQIPSLLAQKTAQEKAVEAENAKTESLQDHLKRLASVPRGSVPEREVTEARLALKSQESTTEMARASIPSIDARVEEVRHEVISRKSQLAEAEVAWDRASLALERHVIRSPRDGIVLHRYASPGQKRMIHGENEKSAVIVELFDPTSLQARIDVPLNEAASLGVGQSVELTTELLPNLLLKGTVTRITGRADLQRNTLQVKVSIENPDNRLRPEMLVRAKFFGSPAGSNMETATPGGTRYDIFVPESAITDNDQIWVVNEDKAELRDIEPGERKREDHRIVLSGIRSGEKVILPPFDQLKPEVRIKIAP